MPSVVRDQLAKPNAPLSVRNWISKPPSWVDVREIAGSFDDASLTKLDGGEGAAIILAVELHADLLLMDDREGVFVARAHPLICLAAFFWARDGFYWLDTTPELEDSASM